MRCPICGNTCMISTICDLCGFEDVFPSFLNKDDAINWENSIVEPYRQHFYAEHLSSIELYIDWSWCGNHDEYECIRIKAIDGKRILSYERIRSEHDFTKWIGEKELSAVEWSNFVSVLIANKVFLWNTPEYTNTPISIDDASSWTITICLDNNTTEIHGANSEGSKTECALHAVWDAFLTCHDIDEIRKLIPNCKEQKVNLRGCVLPGNLPIEELDFSVRIYYALKGFGVDCLADLVSKTSDEIMNIKGIGPKSYREIADKLSRIGVSLK